MGSDRNAPCACQSGKKYKHCCATVKPRTSNRLAAVWLILFVAAAAWGLLGVAKRAISPAKNGDGQTVAAKPPGPSPPGKEWCYDHGQWHDIDGGEPSPAQFAPEPEEVETVTDGSVSYSE